MKTVWVWLYTSALQTLFGTSLTIVARCRDWKFSACWLVIWLTATIIRLTSNFQVRLKRECTNRSHAQQSTHSVTLTPLTSEWLPIGVKSNSVFTLTQIRAERWDGMTSIKKTRVLIKTRMSTLGGKWRSKTTLVTRLIKTRLQVQASKAVTQVGS